jgi:hypothetical protein
MSKKRGNSMLRGHQDDDDDEEQQRRNPASRFIKRSGLSEVVSDFAKAATALTSVGLKSAAAAGAAQENEGGAEQVKTLKEVLEEREEQMKDIEQLQGNHFHS